MRNKDFFAQQPIKLETEEIKNYLITPLSLPTNLFDGNWIGTLKEKAIVSLTMGLLKLGFIDIEFFDNNPGDMRVNVQVLSENENFKIITTMKIFPKVKSNEV